MTQEEKPLVNHVVPLGLTLVVLVAFCVSCVHGGGKTPPPGKAMAPAPRVEKANEGLVNVKCDAEEYVIRLVGSGATVELKSGSKSAKAPAGKYDIAECLLGARDAQGAKWQIYSTFPLPWKRIAANETVEFACGAPLTASVVAQKASDSYAFQLKLVGAGGESYSPSRILRNGERADAPRIEIRDEQGKVVAQGSFRYG